MRGLRFHVIALTLCCGLKVSAADPAPTPQVRSATNRVPPWSVSRPPVPSRSAPIVPGGTFQRPGPTFATPPGSFSRPTSTFASPASAYTPTTPVQPGDPGLVRNHRPHSRGPINLYPNSVIIQQPVTYEPYYTEVPVEVPQVPVTVPAEAAPQATVTESPVAAPVVVDLPPGAVIRRPAPASPASATAPAESAAAPLAPPAKPVPAR